MELTANQQQEIIILQRANFHMQRQRMEFERLAVVRALNELEAAITRDGDTPLKAIMDMMERNGLNTVRLKSLRPK